MMNWHTALGWPATGGQCQQLVDMKMAALRDVYVVDAPNDLAYHAWRDAESLPTGAASYPDTLEPRVSHVDLPQLGVAPMRASS